MARLKMMHVFQTDALAPITVELIIVTDENEAGDQAENEAGDRAEVDEG